MASSNECFVARRVEARQQAAAALERWQADRAKRASARLGAKAQLQAFFNQMRQAGALLGRQRFGIGAELIVEVQSGFYARWSFAATRQHQ